jgi:hypothetical protein
MRLSFRHCIDYFLPRANQAARSSPASFRHPDTDSIVSASPPTNLGTALRQHQRLIGAALWARVNLYFVLLRPSAMAPPTSEMRYYSNSRLFNQLIPAMGNLEASRHGRNHWIPR